MPGVQRSTAKKEMEALASQLLRLRGKVFDIEKSIFEVARLYSTLPLELRKDKTRLVYSDPEVLEACFFDAVKGEQEQFWGGRLGQAKWVFVWAGRGREWVGDFGRGTLDMGVAGAAVEVVRAGLAELEGEVRRIRYELLGFSKEEREGYFEQSAHDQEECLDGAMRFLYFWLGTEEWLQRGFGKGELGEEGTGREEDRDLLHEAVKFLHLGDTEAVELERVEEATGDSDSDYQYVDGKDVKMDFFEEEEDSGVFLEVGRESVDSRTALLGRASTEGV